MIMNTDELEKYIFDRYKCYVKRHLLFRESGVVNHWEVIQDLQIILNTFFEYDFPYDNGHYIVIKNEKTIYEYDI